jgi:pimeloyl-ACP methyl ester carboxylesterase
MASQNPAPPTGATAAARSDRADPRARLLAEIPAAERSLTAAGIETSVLEGGEGPPIVLLHGPGEFGGKWMRVIPGLRETHRVIAPDLPAHGASGLPDDGVLDTPRILAWLAGLIEQTCPEPPVVVGHVLGGAIAARFAIEQPRKLARLVLVDSLGLARFRPTPGFALTLLAFQAAPSERSYDRFMRQCSRDLDRLRDEMGERWRPFVSYNLEGARGPNSKAVGRMLRTVGLPRIPPEQLSRIAVPTRLIWGRQDRANRLRIAERASERYGWPLRVVEDCADDPARDRPEAFLDDLRLSLAP